jgi:hypothetical protein
VLLLRLLFRHTRAGEAVVPVFAHAHVTNKVGAERGRVLVVGLLVLASDR